MEPEITKVGIGVMIFKDGKILLGRRKSSHGIGDYAFPGGKLEYMESFQECAEREVMEEAGIKIKNIRFNLLGNESYPGKHFAHIGLIADWESGEVQNMEPEKCEGWEWYDLNALPEPLYRMAKLGVENLKTHKNYYDKE
jgi:8-oxo-dGTP diphosphatase